MDSQTEIQIGSEEFNNLIKQIEKDQEERRKLAAQHMPKNRKTYNSSLGRAINDMQREYKNSVIHKSTSLLSLSSYGLKQAEYKSKEESSLDSTYVADLFISKSLLNYFAEDKQFEEIVVNFLNSSSQWKRKKSKPYMKNFLLSTHTAWVRYLDEMHKSKKGLAFDEKIVENSLKETREHFAEFLKLCK